MEARIPQRDLLLAIIVFAGGILCLAPGVFWGLPDGKAVEGGLRILDGQVPYRDFWTMYAPGHFYAVAASFWIFGQEIIVQAVGVVLIIAASAAVFYLLLRRIGSPRPLALALAVIFIGMFWKTGPELTSYPPALLLLLLAMDRVVSYFQGSGVAQLYWAGLLTGLAAVFKHDVAAYVAAATVVSLFLAWFRAGNQRPSSWIAPMGAALRFGTSASLVVLLVGAWITWSAGADAWQDLIVFPATTFPKVRNEGYPSLLQPVSVFVEWLRDPTNLNPKGRTALDALSDWILMNLPQLVFLSTASVIAFYPRRLDATSAAVAILWLTCMPFFWMAAQVQRNTHVYSMAILSFFIVAMAWRLASRTPWGRPLRWVFAVVICVYAVGLAIEPGMYLFLAVKELPESKTLDLPGVKGIRLSDREFNYYYPIGVFLRQHTAPDERIYAGLLRHDAPVFNKPIFYAVAQRRSCCRYSELHPGVIDRLKTQQEIISDIERYDVRAAIIWKFGWPDTDLDRRRAGYMVATEDGGATLLDDYIAERFEPIAQYDEYVLMWRKDALKPTLTPP